jgi:PhzF family phenazine biosynthesis protein
VKLPLYQVDAFTDRLFGGNPAAVCPLKEWLPDATMQAIAAENNLSETAFFAPEGDGFLLRWFTPTFEIDLCGHATLASAFIVFQLLEPNRRSVSFRTLKAGVLNVKREGELLAMDFPARPGTPVAIDPALAAALGKAPLEVLAARDHMVVYEHAADVAGLAPDFRALAKLDCFAVIATAPGTDGVDFVSRFFAPGQGLDEDPVTGSSHCTLTPYWAARLGKTTLEARQLSKRGGVLTCTLSGARVGIAGRAVLYLTGEIAV